MFIFMNGWLSPFEAFTQNAFPFPSIEIKNKPALKLRAGLSSLGELVICFSRGEMFSFVPQCVTGHRLDAGGIPTPDCTGTHPAKLECRAKGVRVLDTPWGTPERCARASGLRRVCDAFDANMLVWPTRTSEYVFCPLSGTSFSGLHIVEAALEADAIIFAPHALPDVDCSESQFMLHMLMGLVKERYGLSIAPQDEDVTRHILSLLSTKLLVIDKQMETVCPSN